MKKNFAIMGCAGFVAPRHLQAIRDTGNSAVVALDTKDSVGILDRYFDDIDFFTEFERFDRHLEKLKRLGKNKKVDYVSICSPNYLHDTHIRFALKNGANAICEKPLVLNPWNLNSLEKLEKETGKKVYTILQLRLHPSIIKLKEKISKNRLTGKNLIDLSYITKRGKWYHYSWKGDISKSGGLATNLGIHFFDMLIWIFGNVVKNEVHYTDKNKIAGYTELDRGKVRWFLSIDKRDLPETILKEGKSAFRSIKINGEELEFSDVFSSLHTEVYKDILAGKGFGIKDARPSIELIHQIRNSEAKITNNKNVHPALMKNLNRITNNEKK